MSTRINKPLHLTLGTAALMSFATVVGAESVPTYSELDENSDGSISKQEAESHEELANRFDEVDTDANGILGWSEFARFESEGEAADPADGQAPNQGMEDSKPEDGLFQ